MQAAQLGGVAGTRSGFKVSSLALGEGASVPRLKKGSIAALLTSSAPTLPPSPLKDNPIALSTASLPPLLSQTKDKALSFSSIPPLIDSTAAWGAELSGAAILHDPLPPPPPSRTVSIQPLLSSLLSSGVKRTRSGSFSSIVEHHPAPPLDSLSPASLRAKQALDRMKSTVNSLREAQKSLLFSGHASHSLRVWLESAGESLASGGEGGVIAATFSVAFCTLSSLLKCGEEAGSAGPQPSLAPILTPSQRSGLSEGKLLLPYISSLSAVESLVSSETREVNARNVAINNTRNAVLREAQSQGRLQSSTSSSLEAQGTFGTASFVSCLPTSSCTSSASSNPVALVGPNLCDPSTPLRSQPVRGFKGGRKSGVSSGGGCSRDVSGDSSLAVGVAAAGPLVVTSTGLTFEVAPPLAFPCSEAEPVRTKIKPHAVRFSTHDFSCVRPSPSALALCTLAPPFHPDPDGFELGGEWADHPEKSAAVSDKDGTGPGCLAYALSSVLDTAAALRSVLCQGSVVKPPLGSCVSWAGWEESATFTPVFVPSTLVSAEAMGGASLPRERAFLRVPPGESMVFHPREGVTAAILHVLDALSKCTTREEFERGLMEVLQPLPCSGATTPPPSIAPPSPALCWNDVHSAASTHYNELLKVLSPSSPLPFSDRLLSSLSSAFRYHIKRAFNPHVYECCYEEGSSAFSLPGPPMSSTPAAPSHRLGNFIPLVSAGAFSSAYKSFNTKPLLSRFIEQNGSQCGGLGRGAGGLGSGVFVGLPPSDSGDASAVDLSSMVSRALKDLHDGRKGAEKTLARSGGLMGESSSSLQPQLEGLPIPALVSLARFSHAHAFLRSLFGHSGVQMAIAGDGHVWKSLRSLSRFAKSVLFSSPQLDFELHMLALESPQSLAAKLEEEGEAVDALGAASTRLFESYGEVLKAEVLSTLIKTGEGREIFESDAHGAAPSPLIFAPEEAKGDRSRGGTSRSMKDNSRPKKRKASASRCDGDDFSDDVKPQRLEGTLAGLCEEHCSAPLLSESCTDSSAALSQSGKGTFSSLFPSSSFSSTSFGEGLLNDNVGRDTLRDTLLEHEDCFLGAFSDSPKLQDIGYPTLYLYRCTSGLHPSSGRMVSEEAFVSCLRPQGWFSKCNSGVEGQEGTTLKNAASSLANTSSSAAPLKHAYPPPPPHQTIVTFPSASISSLAIGGFSFSEAAGNAKERESVCPQCSKPLASCALGYFPPPSLSFGSLFGGSTSASPARAISRPSFITSQEPLEGLAVSCERCQRVFHTQCVGVAAGSKWKCNSCWGK